MINIKRFASMEIDYRDLPYMLKEDLNYALNNMEPFPLVVKELIKNNIDKLVNIVIVPIAPYNEDYVHQIDYFIYREYDEFEKVLEVIKISEFDNTISKEQYFFVNEEVYLNLLLHAERDLFLEDYDV